MYYWFQEYHLGKSGENKPWSGKTGEGWHDIDHVTHWVPTDQIKNNLSAGTYTQYI